MKTSFYRFAALLLFAAALTAGCGERTDDMRLLYWNIQNGMWSDQSNGYDNFVAWVKGYNPDVCVWCEAQSIYKSGTAERMDSVDRYLTANWGELAARYGHKYWYVGGHRDNFPQVVTSKYPIENVRRIVGQAPDSIVSHGAGWARIVKNGRPVNIVTLHTWPQAYAFQAVDRDASKAEHGGDRYRRMEIEYICSHTIATQSDAGQQLWMMMGDFNSRSRRDNRVYNYPDDDTRLLVHDYIALCRRDRGEAPRRIPHHDPRAEPHRLRLLHAAALRADHPCRGDCGRLHRAGARSGQVVELLPPLGPPSDSGGL